MNGITRALQLLSAACLGVYAGAMLTEGFVLVTWWRSIDAADFLAWYAANDSRLVDFFSPLTITTMVGALVAAAASITSGHPGRWLTTAAFVLTAAAVGSYFVYFEAVNASFSSASIAPEAVPAELARWAAWHQGRMLLSVAALACGILALRRDA
jgi:hypothetical protein